jgi:drug/metabolite transporter (DMT)-like permease
VAEGLAIVAAVAFAFGTVLQQRGALATEADQNDPRFLVQILHQPVWVLGGICQALGWILQAMALDRGPLVTVQSLTALSLVFALPLGVWLTRQHLGRREIAGAVLTLVGIVFFLSAGEPEGGTAQPGTATWWAASLIILAIVLILASIGRKWTGSAKALTLGSAAGLAYGLQAAVTKTFVAEIGGGVLGLLTSWSVYVLVLSAVTGFVFQQSALKTGVLAPAMASSNSVTLFSSVLLGVAVYGEKLSSGGAGHASAACVGLAVAIAGIVLLAGAEPPDAWQAGPSDAPEASGSSPPVQA